MNRPGTFKPGEDERRNLKGGAQPGAGRPPNWLRTLSLELVEKHKLVEFLANVSTGKVKKAAVRDQLKAIEMLLDRADGKPRQSVEVSGDATINLIDAMKEARKRRGLPAL